MVGYGAITPLKESKRGSKHATVWPSQDIFERQIVSNDGRDTIREISIVAAQGFNPPRDNRVFAKLRYAIFAMDGSDDPPARLSRYNGYGSLFHRLRVLLAVFYVPFKRKQSLPILNAFLSESSIWCATENIILVT